MTDIQRECTKEIKRLSKNVRIILNKPNISNNDLNELNDLYNDLDYYNEHKNAAQLKKALLEDYDGGAYDLFI